MRDDRILSFTPVTLCSSRPQIQLSYRHCRHLCSSSALPHLLQANPTYTIQSSQPKPAAILDYATPAFKEASTAAPLIGSQGHSCRPTSATTRHIAECQILGEGFIVITSATAIIVIAITLAFATVLATVVVAAVIFDKTTAETWKEAAGPRDG